MSTHHFNSKSSSRFSPVKSPSKINKRHQIRKEEVKLSLFADSIIFYLENTESMRKVLELASKSSKVSRHKINM